MNEKNIFIVCLSCLLLFTLSGCCTRAAVYNHGDGAYRVRAHIGELSDQQTESAISSEQLNGTVEGARETSENLSGELTGSRTESEQLSGTVEGARETSENLSSELTGSRAESESLEQSITDGKGDIERLVAILQRIRERGDAENGGDANRDR